MTLNQRIASIPLPRRMAHLPISPEGYPVPWFVPIVDGKWDFRCMDGAKMQVAIHQSRCWLCGEPLGVHKTFAIGPMCTITRSISEPASHLECATYGVQACPFLTQPRMRRNEKDLPEGGHVAGIGIKRNPGVTALWTCRRFHPFRAPNGGVLFELGEPEHVEYWSQGRRATRAEVLASIESGLPLLLKHISNGDELALFAANHKSAMSYLPET